MLSAIVLLTLGVTVVLVQRSQLVRSLDRSLAQRFEALAAELEEDSPPTILPGADGDRFVQIIRTDGSVVSSTSNLADAASVVEVDELGYRTIGNVPIEDDRYRILVSPLGRDGSVVVVGENADDVGDAVLALAASLGVGAAVALALLGALAWWLVGRTIAPVERIRAEVATIGLDRLDRRVPMPAGADEVSALATTMNTMLDRLERSNRVQQQFIADASHELRSPLTRLRSTLEVDLADPAVDLDETAASLLDDVTDLQDLIDGLLFLARSDGDQATGNMVPVDLDALIEVELRAARTETESIEFDASRVEPVMLDADATQMTRLVRNLVSNALRHASTRVELVLRETDGHVELVVEDDGAGIPHEERELIFERFVRLDDSRSASTGGAGLGLSIAKEIVGEHGGEIRVEDGASGGGARFVVELPLAKGDRSGVE